MYKGNQELLCFKTLSVQHHLEQHRLLLLTNLNPSHPQPKFIATQTFIMQLIKALALAPLALAMPLETRQDSGYYHSFTAVSFGARQQSLQLDSFEVRNYNLYLGGRNGAYCPVSPSVCSTEQNITAFTATYGANNVVYLDGQVPGGQTMFIRSDGSVGYTVPHSGLVPDGAITKAFTVSPGEEQGETGYFNPTEASWIACPEEAGSDSYQVFADIAGFEAPAGTAADCQTFVGRTSPFSGNAAFQYDG